LNKEKVLVVGLGETGLPLYELLKECGKFTVYGFDIDPAKMREIGQAPSELPNTVDVMHVCIPYASQQKFVRILVKNIGKFHPGLVIINSTVPPGTTARIHEQSKDSLVAHSPIRGVHKSREYMKWEIKRWKKYIGGATREAANATREHFEKVGLNTTMLNNSTETELAKLFETTYRAWMISCFQEMHRITNKFKADFNSVVDFLEDTHRERLDRPIMFPGEIGGHCVIPNVKLLMEVYDSEFLQITVESNEKRKQELKDPKIKEEAEKVRKRSENLQKELMDK